MNLQLNQNEVALLREALHYLRSDQSSDLLHFTGTVERMDASDNAKAQVREYAAQAADSASQKISAIDKIITKIILHENLP